MIRLFRLLGWASEPAQPLSSVDLFLAGHSINAISAPAGQGIIQRQREIEQELRSYIYQLECENASLQAQIDTCNGR